MHIKSEVSDEKEVNNSLTWWNDQQHRGREVEHDDISTEWAIWCCSTFHVHKYAFETESEAREALNIWSYYGIILTYNNVEMDAIGTYLAPSMGRLREAIDNVRKVPIIKVVSSHGTTSSSSSSLVDKSQKDERNKIEDDDGDVNFVDSEWAVWIYETSIIDYGVKRYGFKSEENARKALEKWYSVRILTFHDEELCARCRYNTDSILAIRRAIDKKKASN